MSFSSKLKLSVWWERAFRSFNVPAVEALWGRPGAEEALWLVPTETGNVCSVSMLERQTAALMERVGRRTLEGASRCGCACDVRCARTSMGPHVRPAKKAGQVCAHLPVQRCLGLPGDEPADRGPRV